MSLKRSYSSHKSVTHFSQGYLSALKKYDLIWSYRLLYPRTLFIFLHSFLIFVTFLENEMSSVFLSMMGKVMYVIYLFLVNERYISILLTLGKLTGWHFYCIFDLWVWNFKNLFPKVYSYIGIFKRLGDHVYKTKKTNKQTCKPQEIKGRKKITPDN